MVALVAFLFLSIVFTGVYTAIMVSLSATTGSTTRATTLAVGFFVLFELAWDAVPIGVVYVLSGFSLPSEVPDWIFLVTQVSPSTSYLTAIVAVLPDTAEEAGVTVGGSGVGVQPTEADPFYVTPEMGLVFLLLWLVVPLVVGYYRFAGSDL